MRDEAARLARLRARAALSRSPILALFRKASSTGQISLRPARSAVVCPKVFSFIDDPDGALEVIYRFAQAGRRRSRRISVDQGACETIDLCAASVLNALALEADEHGGVRFEGRFPRSKEAREIVLATGLPRVLRMAYPKPDSFLTHELVRGGATAATAAGPSRDAKQTEEFTHYIDRCLARFDHQLTPTGRAYLGELIGEVLSNAEEFSGLKEWWIAGYLRHRKDQPTGDCHITIFSFGKTLEQTLRTLPQDSQLRQEIDYLVSQHTAWRAFTALTRRLSEEDLWTMYALQEGVSLHNAQVGVLGHRGKGTVRMIEMFQRLGRTKVEADEPVMALQSGRTHILFDRDVTLEYSTSQQGEPRRIIAFNKANDLTQPPDARHVRSTRLAFPGVLLSLRFFLDRQYLQEGKSPYAVPR